MVKYAPQKVTKSKMSEARLLYFYYKTSSQLPAAADQLLLTRLEDRVRDGHGGHGLEHVGHQPCVPKSTNTAAQASASWLSAEACLSARSCSRLPRAPASLGQSAAWAALAGPTGLDSDRAAYRPLNPSPRTVCRRQSSSPVYSGRTAGARPYSIRTRGDRPPMPATCILVLASASG